MRFALLILMMMTSSLAFATPTFTNLSADDFDKISKEFAADFGHHSVTGAATLGRIFGVELALVGGQMPSPDINTIVKNNAPGSELPNLYHGGLLAGLSIPFGFSGELVEIPKVTVGGADFQAMSLGLKWTLDESLLVLPFNLAVRGTYSTAGFSFSQNSNGVVGTVKDDSTVTGLQILVSPKLIIFEPYAGIGILSAKNSLGVSGTGTVFNSSVTQGQSADNNSNGTEILLGVNVKILLISLGAEYFQAFGASGYTAKLGLAF